jgi:uncharacterized protein
VVAGSVKDALERCSAALAAMISALRDRGVADADIGTAGAAAYAAHDEFGHPRGWTATQQLTVRLRDVSGSGELISMALAAAGDAARLHNLSFEVADDTPAREEARRRAFADAKATAQLYAELAGRELGAVRAVTEGGGAVPYPMESAVALRAASMPVEPGSLDVRVGVTVQWDFVG